MNQQIGFTIIEYNLKEGTLIVRPYSSLFKKKEEEYPILNISLSNIDFLGDISTQIIEILFNSIEQIVKLETLNSSESPFNVKEILDPLVGKRVAMPKIEIYKNMVNSKDNLE